MHDLRHTSATLALINGDDVKTVQANLGHATAAFTLQRYVHASEEMKRASANRMQQFFIDNVKKGIKIPPGKRKPAGGKIMPKKQF